MGIDLVVRIVDSSRPIPGRAGVFKHSYHLIGANLVFATNYGALAAFVQDFAYVHREDALFFAGNDGKCIIDTSVYTKNRQLRTPLSCKLDDSTKTPLTLLEPWCGTNDIGDVFVTNPAADLPVIGLEDFTNTIPPSTVKRAACCRSGGGGGADERVPVRDEVVHSLQALLDAAGSRGCQVTPHACPPGSRGTQNFPCRNVGTRVCLVSEGEEHVHNNAWLSVEQDCAVSYSCHAPSCKAKGPRYIGDLDSALLEPEGLSVPSITSKFAAANMELDDGAAEAPSPCGDDGCLNQGDSSQCSSMPISSSSSNGGLSSVICQAVIRHFALMGPASSEEELCHVLSCAAKAAGGQSAEDVKTLKAAALEWTYRFLPVCRISQYADNEEEFAAYQSEVESYFALDTCTPGCADALAELQSVRHRAGCWFNYRPDAEPHSNGYNRNMPADIFTRRLDSSNTHALSLVLAARMLWPMEQAKFLQFIRFYFVRSKVDGLEADQVFEKVWNLGMDEAAGVGFKEYILDQVHIMVQPFLRDTLPSIMHGSQVVSYNLALDTLSFWLDSAVPEERCVEYIFNFYTGDITSSKGEGIIRQLYGVKRFFKKDDNINAIADMLADETGIKNKMRFDADDESWRILDDKDGVWKHPLAKFETESQVSAFIDRALRPLQQVEELFGKELVWEDRIEDCNDEAGEGRETDIRPDESASQVGSKRSRGTASTMSKMRRTRLSQALFKFAQTPNNQSEILKILQKSLVMSFVQMQKPYLLCCPNGLVDLRNGKLMGKPKPTDFITDMCSTEYNPQADIAPAVRFFERFFPLGAFPDQQARVGFFQQFYGYSLTLENNQQISLCIYGGGSNGKSVLNKMLQRVSGKDICKVIPYESLLKARGQNNDALDDAKRARIVTIEEINDNGKEKEPNSATFKNLASGDTITTKSMYKKAKNSVPVMKLVFMLNKLPKIYFTDYAVKRRLVVVNFTSIFVDESKAFDKQQADELRKRGAPECLIQVKDELYFETHVQGHEPSFLRFFVEGAVTFYQTNHISIPASMQETAVAEASKPSERLYAFFMQRLSPVDGVNTALEDIEEAFFASVGDSVNRNTYTRPVLGKDLSKIIKEKRTLSAEWRNAFSDQRVHPVTKEKCTMWFNVKLSPPPRDVPAAERFAVPQRPSNGAGSSSA